MGFFGKLFAKSPADYLAKGDNYMESGCFFDARTCYEDGCALSVKANDDLKDVFAAKIDEANRRLAELNIAEAEHAFSRGDNAKAIDHLELVKTLTYDETVREKAERLLLHYQEAKPEQSVPVQHSGCGSCGSSAAGDCADSVIDDSLPLMEHYELIIQQLPAVQYHRYAVLGENFAYAYVAASQDQHSEAISALETCAAEIPQDIYLYEKGKLLHRLGDDVSAEQVLRQALEVNETNELAWLSLALFFSETHNYQAALDVISQMVEKQILPEQALLIGAEIFEAVGELETAINQYIQLLQTAYARVAAEKLYGVLMAVGRHTDAAAIFKKYLNKSCH